MTETDDPKVKAHIACKHEQRMKRLSELELNEKNINNFFESREIKPSVTMAHYDIGTKKYKLGNWIGIPPALSAQFSTTSLGTNTLTVPTGHIYRVWLAGTKNDTRAAVVTVTAVVNGTTVTDMLDGGSGALTQLEMEHVIGATSSGSSLYTVNGPVTLRAGDTITITQSNFQAADVVGYYFLFEDWTVV